MTSASDPVFSTRESGVAEIVLNRPARRNAVTGPLAERLHAEIVAALERFAINAGSALALAADLLVAGEQAFLHVGEIQMGMAAPMNMAWLRLRHPESVAARLAIVGRRYTGAELERMGVACEVTADDEVLTRARELSATIAGYPQDGVRSIKRAVLHGRTEASGHEWFAAVRGG